MPYRSLAVQTRFQEQFYTDHDRSIFLAVVLELAHALSRGRRPSSSCMLPGINLREWLQKVYMDVSPFQSFGYKDYYGDPCSLADSMSDDIYGYSPVNDVQSQKMIRAITLVGNELVYPRKLEKRLRGDPAYQLANKSTNLKRKQRYWERRQESHYDRHDDACYRDHDEFRRYPSGLLTE
jgi:hypothetical protein